MRPRWGKAAAAAGALTGAYSAEVRRRGRHLAGCAVHSCVTVVKILMESYLYVDWWEHPAYIIVQQQLVFNQFFYFPRCFSLGRKFFTMKGRKQP